MGCAMSSIFVVDTSVYSQTLNNLSLDVFPEIYEPWSLGMTDGTIISVDEVYRELDARYGSEAKPAKGKKDTRTKEAKWLKQHKDAFLPMTADEGNIVAEIFKNKKFREGVKEKSLRLGTPEADAILVAKAKCSGGIVVTAESNKKPNAEKIPNICVAFGLSYITKDDFHRVLKNLSSKQPALKNVTVLTALQV